MDSNEKFVTALELSQVDIDHFETVYDFMMKVGPEPCAVFESLWVGNDPEREEKLLEVKLKYRDAREKEVRNILLDETETRQVLDNEVKKIKKLVKRK